MGGSGFLGFGQSKSEPKDMTPNEFKAMRDDVAGQLMTYMSGGGPQYQGPFAAPIGGSEADQLDLLDRMAAGVGSPLERAASEQLLSSVRGDFLRPESNPYLKATSDAAVRQLTQQLDQAELGNRSLFHRAGQKLQESSPFATAQGITNRAYADAVGDVNTRIFGENFQRERDRQIESTQLAGDLDRFRFARGVENLKAQALPRMIEEFGIDRGIAEFNRFVEDIMEAMGLAGTLAAPDLGQSSKSFEFKHGGGGGVGGGGGSPTE